MNQLRLKYRCFAVLFAIVMFFTQQSVTAQKDILSARINIAYQNISVSDLLEILSKKYAIKFTYSSDIIPLKKKITIDARNQKIETILQKLFTDTGVSYVKVGDQLVLRYNPSLSRPSSGDSGRPEIIVFDDHEKADSLKASVVQQSVVADTAKIDTLILPIKYGLISNAKSLPEQISVKTVPVQSGSISKKIAVGAGYIYSSYFRQNGGMITFEYNPIPRFITGTGFVYFAPLNEKTETYDYTRDNKQFFLNAGFILHQVKYASISLDAGYSHMWTAETMTVSFPVNTLTGQSVYKEVSQTTNTSFNGFNAGMTFRLQYHSFQLNTGYRYCLNLKNDHVFFSGILYRF